MSRVAGWEERLFAALAAREAVPFRLGVADCGTLARACEIALTGATRFGDVTGYSTPRGLARVLLRLGAGSLEELLDARLARLPRVLQARRGDVVMRFERVGPGTGGPGALGVVTGADAVFTGPAGLLRLPVATAALAWEVG